MSRLQRLIALTRNRRALLLPCAWALLRAGWRVRTWPFARLAATLGARSSPATAAAPQPSAGSALDLATAADVRWAVSAWARAWPRPPTCLMRAIAARELLVRRGLACEIYFGVRGQGSATEASPAEIGAMPGCAARA